MKEMYRELMRERPGRRFYSRYCRWKSQRRESILATTLYVVLGVLAVLLGIVFSFWPVIPGFVFVLAGFGLLSARSKLIAQGLDRLELGVRRLIPLRWRSKSAG